MTEESEKEVLTEELSYQILRAEVKNIAKKVAEGKTLTRDERAIIERKKPIWEKLNISRRAWFNYKKQGIPLTEPEAREWLTLKAGLQQQGSGKIEIGGREYTAQDLIDLRAKLMERQSENMELRNRIENLNVLEREGKLLDADELNETLIKILFPLKKALDQMPENISTALNPDDPTRAETILEQELENIYADLVKTLKADEHTRQISV